MLRLGLPLVSCRKTLQPTLSSFEQIRTTFVLKRRHPPMLDKKNQPPKHLRVKNFIYEVEENTNMKPEPDLKVILTSIVDGVGLKNDIVSVRPNFARKHLLLNGLAVYASPENLEKLKLELAKRKEGNQEELLQNSSRFAELTRRELARRILKVYVSKENPWTLEKWHIRAAFRRSSFWVPDHAIKMNERAVSGPNAELEGKVFLVTVTINNLETTPVRCMILHRSKELGEESPEKEGLLVPPHEPIFEDERQQISELPPPKLRKPSDDVL